MRKTSQDGADTSSITSGIENEVRKTAAVIAKAKKSSIKRKVQSSSHESDDGVVEPLLQKDKPESMTQSAKNLLSKSKTDIKSDKIDDKDKPLSESKCGKSQAINVTRTETTNIVNVSKGNSHRSSSSQISQIPNTVHNHMNNNVFCTSDGLKSTITTKSQMFVEVDGSKPSSYNSSSLIFTTAKIHSDGKSKNMEPVQMTPVPILSTAESNIVKANIICETKKTEIGKPLNECKILDNDLKHSDSVKRTDNVIQSVLTSSSTTIPNNTSYSDVEKMKDISTTKTLDIAPTTSKILESKIRLDTITPSKKDSQSNQEEKANLRSNEQKNTFKDDAENNKHLQSRLSGDESHDIGAVNIKETEKVIKKMGNFNKDLTCSSNELNSQKVILEDTKDNSKIETKCNRDNSLVQAVNVSLKSVLDNEKQSAHILDNKMETKSVTAKKVAVLTNSEKSVSKGSHIRIPIKTVNPKANDDSKNISINKSSDLNKKNDLVDTRSNIFDATSTAAQTKGTSLPTKIISSSKIADQTQIKGNVKSSVKSSQNDKGANISMQIRETANNKSTDSIKPPKILNETTSTKVSISASKPIPTSQNTVNVMSSTSSKPSSHKSLSGNSAKTTAISASNISGPTVNIKTTGTTSLPETSVTSIGKDTKAAISKNSQSDAIKPANIEVKPLGTKTKLQATVATSSKNKTFTKSSNIPSTIKNTTDSKSKPTTKSSQSSMETKNDKAK